MADKTPSARTCPKCWAEDSRVCDVRLDDVTDILKRRRECRVCGHRWTTFEISRYEYMKLTRGTAKP